MLPTRAAIEPTLIPVDLKQHYGEQLIQLLYSISIKAQLHCVSLLNIFENFLACFIIASHTLHDDVTTKHKMSLSRRESQFA